MSTTPDTIQAETPRANPVRDVARFLSPRNVSAIWVLVGIFIVFALWIPDTYLQWSTWRTLLGEQATTAIVGVALVLPLSAGTFDLAVGTELGLAAIFAAWLLAEQGLGTAPTIGLTLAAGGCVGIVSGLLVVKARIDSFIATLGISSVLLALIAWISSEQQLPLSDPSFQELGTTQIFGISLPFFVMLATGIVVWYLLERTAIGRRIYATGGNLEAAKLAGISTSLVIVLCLVACGVIAGIGGVLTTATLGAGDPTIGPAYLLPAFTAAFLGSTQFRSGRFNVFGTILAVYVLAAGVKGLQLAGAPTWIPDLFNGVALLIAVGAAKFQRGGSGRIRRIRGKLRRRRDGAGAPSEA